MPEGNKTVQVNEALQKQGENKSANREQIDQGYASFVLNSMLQHGDLAGEHLSPPAVEALRGVLGNRAISHLLERQRGAGIQSQEDEQEDTHEELGGLVLVTEPEATPVPETSFPETPTTEEAEADVNRPAATGVGNVIGAAAAALTGISISSTTNAGPTFLNRGRFNWQVGFSTTGQNGWIVQEVVNTERAEDSQGLDVIEEPASPHYWEAWVVDATGNVTPANGADNDYWTNPPYASGSHGHWSTTASLYFTKTNPATQGFSRRNPHTNAGDLLSSTSAPAGLGMARLYRYAQGAWDSTGAHTGSAG